MRRNGEIHQGDDTYPRQWDYRVHVTAQTWQSNANSRCHYLLCWLMYWKRRVLRLGCRVHMVPSVVLAIIAFGFWAGLDISKHALSFSSVVLVFQS